MSCFQKEILQYTKKESFYDQIITGDIIVEDRLSGDILEQDLEHADPNSPFYDKKVVFTGVLESISRSEAAEIVKAMGADINNSISSLTDYVIVGADAGPSKLKKRSRIVMRKVLIFGLFSNPNF